MLNKINKTVRLLRKLQSTLPRPSLLTIYKSFIRPHLDYGDDTYDQVYIASFQQKVESIQYNAVLVIQELHVEHLKESVLRAMLRVFSEQAPVQKVCCFYKILKEQSSKISF